MKLSLSMFDNILKLFFEDQRIAVLVTFFLVFYGGLAGPKLPTFVESKHIKQMKFYKWHKIK